MLTAKYIHLTSKRSFVKNINVNMSVENTYKSAIKHIFETGANTFSGSKNQAVDGRV